MKKRFIKLGATENIASDFEWIVSCAENNAYFGYGIGELYNSNSTVRDYVVRFGLENIKPVIDALGKIGWAICEEDTDECKNAWKKFEKVFEVWNGNLKSE